MQTVRAIFVSIVLSASVSLNSSQATETSDVSLGARPAIAISGKGEVFVGFEGYEKSSNVSDIFVSSSVDGGKTWTAPVNVSKTTGASSDPDIVVEQSGAIDLVWSDTKSGDDKADIFFSRSSDGGKTWQIPLDVSNTSATSSAPAIAQSNDQSVNIVWQDTVAGEMLPQIYYSQMTPSKDAGLHWSTAENVSKTPGAASEPALVGGADNKLRLVWIDTTSGSARPDVFYRIKEGGAWSAYVNVSHSPRISSVPAIACGKGGHSLIVWLDNSHKVEDPDIWAAVEKKPGHFGKAINVSDSRGVSSEPAIASDDSGRVAVVWSDSSRNLANFDAVTRLSLNNLDEISATLNLSKSLNNAKLPDVAVWGDDAFFVWQERQAGNTFVKFAKTSLKGIATGPSEDVDPSIHAHNRNARN
jgi:hypothetical protein